MNETTKNKWIGVAVALIVVAIFFEGLFFYFNNQEVAEEITNNNSGINISPTTENMEPINTTSPEGLIITDIVVGAGQEAKAGDTISVNYVGTLENGTKFDSSYDRGQAFSFTLGVGQVIQGWDQGVVGMKVGGKRKLVIPAALAYGNQAVGGVIPANSTLVFEVELVGIQK